MNFSVNEELYRLFPGLKIGVLVLRVENTGYGEDHLTEALQDIQTRFPFEKPQDHPNIRVWRTAFTKLGVSATKFPSSIESLVRRALKGGSFPRINPIVDLYNAMSLKYLLPMGGHAVEPLAGNITLGFAKGGERFMPMDSAEAEAADKGEVIYRDGVEVLTRRWVWRQCEKDKVTPETTTVFVPIDVIPGLENGLCESAMEDMEKTLTRHHYGRVTHKDILTEDHRTTSF